MDCEVEDAGSRWREGVRQMERDEVRNCKRCEHYLPNREEPPVCLRWSRVDGRVSIIGIGWSGVRNDAPFCQFFKGSK